MSLFVTKLLSLFVHPLSLGMVFVGTGIVVGNWWRRSGMAFLVGGVLVLWVASAPLVSDWLRGRLEGQHPPTRVDSLPSAEAAVVLGGGMSPPRPPRIHPDLNDAADRVWHAARLYHAGKVPLVIASGGTQPWKRPDAREAPATNVLLQDWGVSGDAILLESKSANTYENATRTAELLDRRGLNCVLLVTSALHMPRALAVFRSAGIKAVPAPTDVQVGDRNYTVLDVLPDAGALAGSTAAIREYVGYLVYDWRGWIDGPAGSPNARDATARCSPSASAPVR
ncbi:uncharacterized SAM-binding protein YcdF (DUF218 family) [Salinibacter ruber]|uniref:YdcF family protein n=1 Tax=Salinibacter ruber TaxID=146919 RepID=UPI0021695EAF|nr:uncharacterized SAM-binding protein YcdF (DUF218 family) [Salinibacter ruber]